MSAWEVGSDRNKNLFVVLIWHEQSVAPYSERISYLLMLQASPDEAFKLMPSQGLWVGFFPDIIPTPHAAACESQPGFPDIVVLPVTSRCSQPSLRLFLTQLLWLPWRSFPFSSL